MRNGVLAFILATGLAGCGGGSSSPAPTPTPTPTPTPQNHSPAITTLSVSPAFGIQQLTSFSAQAAATDQDSDPLTYEWDFGDSATGAGAAVNHAFTTGGPFTVKVTVKDGNGGSVSDSRSVLVGSMTGRWQVDIPTFVPLQLDLQQDNGVVTGTFLQLQDGPATPKGTTGKTDPAEPGKIDANGQVEIRFKVGIFLDFYLRGTMDQTGKKITGGVFGSGFGGNDFTAVKQ
jgi:hypothetical protein